MEYNTILCNCKNVTLGQVEDVVRRENRMDDVMKVFEDVQKETNCSTGCGGCHNKILDVISDMLYK